MLSVGGLSSASTSVALAAAAISLFGFLRWLIPFLCVRMDARADRVERREQDVDRKMVKRLEHVEQELELFREATMKMIARMAEVMPGDVVLLQVAQMLKRRPRSPGLPLDELTDKLGKMA